MKRFLLLFCLCLPLAAQAQTDVYQAIGSTVTPTCTIGALASDTARQCAKADLQIGATGDLASRYRVHFQIDTGGTAPTAGLTVVLYASFSSSGTAGTDNDCGASGSDAAYTGYSSNLTNSLRSCTPICTLVLTNVSNQEHVTTCLFAAPTRYVNFIVVNRSGQTLGTTHDLELQGLYPQVQ